MRRAAVRRRRAPIRRYRKRRTLTRRRRGPPRRQSVFRVQYHKHVDLELGDKDKQVWQLQVKLDDFRTAGSSFDYYRITGCHVWLRPRFNMAYTGGIWQLYGQSVVDYDITDVKKEYVDAPWDSRPSMRRFSSLKGLKRSFKPKPLLAVEGTQVGRAFGPNLWIDNANGQVTHNGFSVWMESGGPGGAKAWMVADITLDVEYREFLG